MKTIKISKILIVGTGSIANKHYRVASDLFPTAEIKAYSESGNSLEGISTLSGFSEIESFMPDVAVIANTSNHHIRAGVMLAKMGVDLLIEKPLSSNMKKVRTLRRIARRKDITIHVGYNLKFLPSMIHLRKILKEQVVGEIFSVRCVVGQDLTDWRPGREYQSTASASKNRGGGVLNELSHEIDYLNWLFGPPSTIFSVSGKMSRLDIDCEDSAHLLLTYGQEGKRKFLVSLDMDMIRKDPTRNCTFIGAKGTLLWNGIQGQISIYNSLERGWETVFDASEQMEDTYINEWKIFSRAVTTDDNSLDNFDSAVETMRIIRLARISNRLRIPVRKLGATTKVKIT
jgi:predicted dehydrogenase